MRVTLPSGTAAELARPDDPSGGALVVLPDIMGLRPLFDDLVQRLSDEQRWSVVAIEPFAGLEDLSLEERLESVGRLDDERLLADVVAAADLLGTEPVGVIGFCMGGMFTLKAAGTGRFRRAVAFYGMVHVPEQWKSDTQHDPLSYVTRPEACPVLAVVGGDDPWTPEGDLVDLEAAGVTLARYPGRDHGFVHDPSRPAHDEHDAADAWRRALEFLTADQGPVTVKAPDRA